jgi:hypothetical protein
VIEHGVEPFLHGRLVAFVLFDELVEMALFL